MKAKLNCIMLIDDNHHDNFFHERVIRKADVSARIVVHKKATDALAYLKSTAPGQDGYPDLILLDINMPGMNGWDFLEEFKRMEQHKTAPVVVVMLTTSNNPDDELKARTSGIVCDFRSKPLTRPMLEEIIDKFHLGE